MTTSSISRAPAFLGRSELGRALWAFRREFFWVGVFSMFTNLLVLTPTVYMLQVYDRVMISGSELTLLAITLLAVGFFAVMGLADWLRSRLLVRAGAKLDEALNARVFGAAFEGSLQRGTGGRSQAFGDLTQVRQFLTGNGVFAFFDLPWTPIYLAVLFLMHPVLGWTSVGFMVLLLALALWGQKATRATLENAQEGQQQLSTFIWGKLRNAESVHAMGMQGNLRQHWLGLHDRQAVREHQAVAASQRLQAVTKFVQHSQQSLILAVGALLALEGEIGVGAMIASNALMGNALRPVGLLVGTWRQFLQARQGYQRLETLLEEFPPRQDRHTADECRGQLTLRRVVASAPGRKSPILEGLDAEFKAGEVVAILGPSGAGKSTLARCLVGVWPGMQGEVLLDGEPMARWSREALGPHIGYLPQEVELLDGTIAENIARFGEVDSERVIEAARRTGIHDMVLRFPKGYDTPMGEAGQLLSGGQRQRIGLARAIYGNPALVVLDEPNANLDDVGEAALARTVRELREGGCTVFMIVHQRALLSVADRVLVMNQGRIERLVPVVVQAPSAPAVPAHTVTTLSAQS